MVNVFVTLKGRRTRLIRVKTVAEAKGIKKFVGREGIVKIVVLRKKPKRKTGFGF